MDRLGLLSALASFKKGREALVVDYCTEEPRLFKPMFSYESNSAEMSIALEKYMLGWLAEHPSYFRGGKKENAEYSDVEVNVFFRAYRGLLKKFIFNANVDVDKGKISSCLEEIVNDSIEYLNKLLLLSERSDVRLEKLRYQSEKSKYLFERNLKDLKEGGHEFF